MLADSTNSMPANQSPTNFASPDQDGKKGTSRRVANTASAASIAINKVLRWVTGQASGLAEKIRLRKELFARVGNLETSGHRG
jgi:hypothetical protein